MDLAVTLIKSVLRAFYPTRDILVVDALILHEALRDDDLAYLMAMNTKELHKICGKLREDRLLSVHTRSELREGNPRPSNRTWYFINYRHTIDAIKWRMFTIDKEVQGAPIPANEKKEYFCRFCGAEWTAMDVLDSVGPNGFLCHRCQHVLISEPDRTSTGHEQSTRLNDQFKFISELLPKIDAVYIAECDFDRALSKARPVVRDVTHQRAQTVPVEGDTNRPMAVRGLTNTGPQSISINISTSEGPTQAEKEAERVRKEKIAEQNALPSWMSNSTVTGESFSRSNNNGTKSVNQVLGEKGVTSKIQANSSTSAQIDDIFEKLKAEQAAGVRQMDLEADDDGDNLDSGDEDDEFEDVPAGTNKASLNAVDSTAVKRESSSATSADGGVALERASKKVKLDPDAIADTRRDESQSDEDEDDDMEFEDI